MGVSTLFPMKGPPTIHGQCSFAIVMYFLLAGHHDLKWPPGTFQQVGRRLLTGAAAVAFCQLVPMLNRATAVGYHHFDVSWLMLIIMLYRLLSGLVSVCIGPRRRMAGLWTLGTLSLMCYLVSIFFPTDTRASGELWKLGWLWHYYALLPLLLPRAFLNEEWYLLPHLHQLLGKRLASGAVFAGCLMVHHSFLKRWPPIYSQRQQYPMAALSLLTGTFLSQFGCVISLSSLLPSRSSVLSRLGDSSLLCLVVHSAMLPHIIRSRMTQPLVDLMAPLGPVAVLSMLYATAFALQLATSAQCMLFTPPAAPRWFKAPRVRPSSWPLFLGSWCFLVFLYLRARYLVAPQVWLPPMITEAGLGRRDLAVPIDARHQFASPIRAGRQCKRASIDFGSRLAHSPLQCALLTAAHDACGKRFMFTNPLKSAQLGCQCCEKLGRHIYGIYDQMDQDLEPGGKPSVAVSLAGSRVEHGKWSTWKSKKLSFSALSPASSAAVADHMGIQFNWVQKLSRCPSSQDIQQGDGSSRRKVATISVGLAASPLQCAILVFAANYRPGSQLKRCGELFLWSRTHQGCRCCPPSSRLSHAQGHVSSRNGACSPSAVDMVGTCVCEAPCGTFDVLVGHL
jgi:hypothetical protein